MYTSWFKSSQWIDFSTVSSIFFGLFFTGVVAWVLFDRKRTFEEVARLPLEDDTGPADASSAANERKP
jgi:cbb3-type cytochrome oxidase subunit 3